MSDSNRGERSEDLGQGLAFLTAIILCCTIVSILTYAWVNNSTADSERAAYYQEEAERNKRTICVGSEGAVFAKCLVEQQRAADGAYQAEQDLNAQRNMAIWAFAMFAIASVTAALTLWALWYIKGTLGETRRMARESINATRAMVGANEITQKIASAELRPYLFVDRIELIDRRSVDTGEKDESGEPIQGFFYARVAVWLKNVGKVPARNIRVFKKEYVGKPRDGRFWRYGFNRIDVPFCAPGHERRVFGQVVILESEREDFDFGFVRYFLRLRFTFENEEGETFSETAGHHLAGYELDTFYLITDHSVAKWRESAKRRAQDEYGELFD